ncbi:thioredoxin domain-containing protein [Sansalvadorimonas verongulae]|uniref:glutaredoxin domain-containing protein n=1 Tax=Sansalvadorimonas verongulae TaxID=2172824 RepID=UPI0012BD2817|nr:glutaredoxin domain-containing protein [Sansalvadorimonas verongulae]MTI14560.1 glutaredoxin [Sansalvadorimonas verongulae]
MKRITIFGRSGCGFCTRAKEVCENKHEAGISQADLEKTVGKKVETLPQIFHGQEYIGGYTELDAFLKEKGIVPAA